MEVNVPDNSMISYSKFPLYLQPYSTPGYSVASDSPVGYTTATVQLRSTHQPAADEPRLSDCGITPSPSGSISSSRDGDINGGETHFRPADFNSISAGTCRSLVQLTPSESSRSGSVASDHGSSKEGDLPNVLLVQVPREAPAARESTEPEEEIFDGRNGTRSSSSPRTPASASPSPTHGITVNLLDKELWQTFKSVGNEMIVTKPGR